MPQRVRRVAVASVPWSAASHRTPDQPDAAILSFARTFDLAALRSHATAHGNRAFAPQLIWHI
jgi:hypothetical protein